MLTLPPEYVALRHVEVLASVAMFIGTMELFAIRAHWGERGTWRWSSLQDELGFARWALATRPFTGLLVARLLAAAWLLREPSLIAMVVAWVTSLAVNVRFRGTYNGGSDHLLMIVLSAVLIGRVGDASPVVVRVAVVWIGVQALLSYTIAGLAKLRDAQWRSGTALPVLLAIPAYGVPTPIQALLQRPGVARAATWGVLVFECGFPLVLLGPRAAAVGIVVAAVFHVANAWVLGLNRFLLTWAATWPALVYVAGITGRA